MAEEKATCVASAHQCRALRSQLTLSFAPAHRSSEPILRFRNHEPSSEALQGLGVERPVVPTVEQQVGSAEVVHNDATQEPLLNLAPKRPNWDLKRDIEPHMKKLRAMTDRASE